MNTVTTHIANNTFTLSVNRTLYWHEQNALIIADVHLGKSTHFRKHGMALPNYVGIKDLENLETILNESEADKIIFLGDLFHSAYNQEWENFITLRNQYARKIFILIEGNHDILHMAHYTKANVQVLNTFEYNGISLLHEPTSINGSLVIAGHIHPGITLEKKGSLSLTLGCFALNNELLLLPAFGTSTGVVPLKKSHYHKLWLIADGVLVEL